MPTKVATGSRKIVIACLGSSSTAAKGSFNWIKKLAKTLGRHNFYFRNFGVGGDLSFNGLQRLSDVIACRPDKVIILIGGNDILASVFDKAWRIFSKWKRLPKRPSPEWYRENISEMVHRLKNETDADIALCSLPLIGENLESENAYQKELNRLFEIYSIIVKETAKAENVTYIPFYERIYEEITKSPGKSFTTFRFSPFYRDAFCHFVLRQSLDHISDRNGWQFHVDGVHLNSRSGMILVELLQPFCSSPVTALTIEKCPICDWKIKETRVKVKVGEHEIIVCCDDCAQKVDGIRTLVPNSSPYMEKR